MRPTWSTGYQPNYVSDWEGKNPKILLCAEAPGQREDEYIFDAKTKKLLSVLDTKGEVIAQPTKAGTHWPLVGRSGQKLEFWWKQVGLTRNDLYITNVYPFRPENNDFKTIDENELARWIEVLHHKIDNIEGINLIVCCGNVALRALTGKTGITDWRGSILSYTSHSGKTIKVIPTLHPAGWFRDPKIAYYCIKDWQRIAADSKFPELNLLECEHKIHPNKLQITSFVREALRNHDVPIATDIENNPVTHEITCIGFALSPKKSITIPTTIDYWNNRTTLNWVWEQIKTLCEGPNPKITQGGLHDAYHLLRLHDIRFKNWLFDTNAEHHCLEPTAPTKLKPHALDKMASVLIRTQFWKKDAKDDDDIKKTWKVKDYNTFWTYNGKDCCYTYAIHEENIKLLREAGKLDLYLQLYQQLFDPLLDMMVGGIRIDDKLRRKELAKILVECYNIRMKVEELVGKPLHANKSFSVQKLQKFFYEDIGFKKMKKPSTKKDAEEGKKPKEESATTDETTLKKLKYKYQNAKKPKPEYALGLQVIDLVLEHREKYQLGTFLADKTVDEDHYVRCKYKFTTEYLRLASSRNPFGTGRNLQNIPPTAKHIFLPDPGHILIEWDSSQAESRILDVLTGDPKLIELAHTPPWEFDVHRFNAAIIFKCSESEVTYEQRYLAKRVVYASSYGMGAEHLSEILFKDGYIHTIAECQEMLDSYMNAFPAIRKWQERTRVEVVQKRKLTNSWGQVFDFSLDITNIDRPSGWTHLYNRACACRPQSDNGINLNQQGVIPIWKYSQQKDMRVCLQVHDSVLASISPKIAWDAFNFGLKSMQNPHNYYGHELGIFANAKIGNSWKNMHEFKEPPTKAFFMEKLHEYVAH